MNAIRKIQYTIRGVPDHVDNLLRQKARSSGKSLNEMALAALIETCGDSDLSTRYHDLDDLSGSWVENAKGFDEAMVSLRRTDPEIWK
jgi:hypothetical protein